MRQALELNQSRRVIRLVRPSPFFRLRARSATAATWQVALSEIEKSVRLTESLRTKVASRDVRASFVASTHRYYELHADILMLLHRQQPSQDFARKVSRPPKKPRSPIFRRIAERSSAGFRQDVDPVLRDREKRLRK